MAAQLGPKLADGRTAEVFAWGAGEAEILKLFRPGFEGGAKYEYGVACAVQSLGALAVPQAKALIEVDGRAAIVYQRIHGETMTHWLSQRPWRVRQAAWQMAELQVSLHQHPAPTLPSQRERLAGRIHELAAFDVIPCAAALTRLQESQEGDRLCHGDFHPENILLTGTSSQPAVIIDWTDASRGDPLYDVARTLALLTVGSIPRRGLVKLLIESLRRSFARHYLQRYTELTHTPVEDCHRRMLPVLVARLTEMGDNRADQIALLAAVSRYP